MTTRRTRRLPRSLRKHLRNRKAELRRTLPAEEAERAVARLERRIRETVEAAERRDASRRAA